jgi:hypothetical protein
MATIIMMVTIITTAITITKPRLRTAGEAGGPFRTTQT